MIGILRDAPVAGAELYDPPAGSIHHALAFGLLQSGRFIREFLHPDFNERAAGKKVFDVMMPAFAGSRHMFMNEAYAQPRLPLPGAIISVSACEPMVRSKGLEPSRRFQRYHLKVVRLPIPPRPQVMSSGALANPGRGYKR